MANWFNRVQKIPVVKHSVNDLSNTYLSSIDMGDLVPFNVVECLPSDKFLTLGNEVYLRFSPLLFPLMHRVKVKTHNFFTPLRIILGDDNYKDWLNGNKKLVSAEITLETSYIDLEEIDPTDKDSFGPYNPFVNTIFDYLGIDIQMPVIRSDETTSTTYWTITVDNPTPILAYFMVTRDWFSDSVLESGYMSEVDELLDGYKIAFASQQSVVWSSSSGTFLPGFDRCFKVDYTKDYFNTARPTPQMGSDMYVLNRPMQVLPSSSQDRAVYVSKDTSASPNSLVAGGQFLNEGTTIRDLWRKEAIQMWEQHSNSFGNRVREQLAAHYGVLISDKRLQIPQYCGGSSTYAQVSEVIQTSASQSSSALGAFGGKASAFSRNNDHGYFCEEHGVMLSLLSLIPDNGYCQGQNRLWFKQDVFDFAIPEFNNIGWQEIYNGEIYMDNQHDNNKKAFGYQPRYSDYRSGISRCTGQFRNSSLLGWHLNRNFDALPPLNANFLKVADTRRIFNSDGLDSTECPIYLNAFNKVVMSRPISKEPDSMHIY